MKKQFCSLYQEIIDSQDEKKMCVLGHVMKQAMFKLMDSSPALAKEYIDELEAVHWNNYLTAKESQDIVNMMTPKPNLAYNKWIELMNKFEFPTSKEGVYNDYALYTAMCMIFSDSETTLNKYVEQDYNKLFELIYHLAIDKLCDKDEKFNIRKYFLE